MSVPTVNVFLTYDPLKMIEFQQTASLNEFKEEDNMVDSFVFNNGPHSYFLSLTHEFGFDGGDSGQTGGPMLALEFIDPRGLFDSNIDFSPTTLIDTKADLLDQQLKKKRAEALGLFNKAYAMTGNPLMPILPKAGFCELVGNQVDLAWLKEKESKLEDEINELSYLQSGNEPLDVEDPNGANSALKAANALIQAHNKQLHRPIYITYGVGDNLADWATPMVFNKVVGLEFNFNATGGRVMKLMFAGVDEYPLLTPEGIMPLGSIGLGTVINGTSRRLFSGEGQKELQHSYPDSTGSMGKTTEVDVKNVIKPSLHKIITDVFKDFLEKAINSYKPANVSNVVVLFPNLDPLLEGYYQAEYESVRASNGDFDGDWFGMYTNDEENITGNMVWNIETTCEVLEGLGFTISQAKNGFKGRVGDSIYNELERQVDDIANFNWLSGRGETGGPLFIGKASSKASPESVVGWLGDRDIRCEMQTDGIIKSVNHTLVDIAERILDRAMEYNKLTDGDGNPEAHPPLELHHYIETDFNTLQVLHKHGIIEDPSIPALIVGDAYFIAEVLDGRMYEWAFDARKESPNWSVADVDEAVQEKFQGWISPYDLEDGWNSELIKDMYELRMPIPWLGPFGPTGNVGDNMDNFLPEDTNLDSNSWSTLKEEQPETAQRVPVFSFGTKNPNILEFNYDINAKYLSLLGTFDYINMSSYQRTTSLLGGSTHAAQQACDILSQVNAFQRLDFKGAKKDGIPLDFVKLIQPYYEGLQGGTGGALVKFGNWEKVFNSLDQDTYHNLDGKEFETENQFYEFMWEAFCALTNGDYKRFQVKQAGINNVGGALTRFVNATSKLANMEVLASMKTTPMFHLSNHDRVVMRQSLVLAVEPKFEGIDKSVVVPRATWFSGLYTLTGFKHTIAKDAVYSEFSLHKPSETGGYLTSGD